jgi:NADH-quinone oxidoreductase subunit M
MSQTDFKKLVAYSSVSHMGLVTLGAAAMTPTSINGALFMMVAHGITSAALFFIVGVIYERAHHREISRFGGLATTMPVYTGLSTVGMFANLGLPGLAGFWGEFPAILSAYSPAGDLSDATFRVYMVVAAVGTVLAAGYLLWMFQRVAFGAVKQEWADSHIHDIHAPEWIAWTPLILLIVALGIYPDLVFRITDGAATNVAQEVAKVIGG